MERMESVKEPDKREKRNVLPYFFAKCDLGFRVYRVKDRNERDIEYPYIYIYIEIKNSRTRELSKKMSLEFGRVKILLSSNGKRNLILSTYCLSG
jgi:hypothetical protein